MTSLTQIIKSETSEMFAKYLIMKAEWAGQYYDKQIQWDTKSIREAFGKKTEIKRFNGEIEVHYSQTKESMNFENKIYAMKSKGRESFIEKEIKLAKLNYEDATEKLALRIHKKGINIENMKVNSVRFKEGDLQTIFTDGVNYVKAFTILAWGNVNAPHYRYLVK